MKPNATPTWKTVGRHLLIWSLVLMISGVTHTTAEAGGMGCDEVCQLYQNETNEDALSRACGKKADQPIATASGTPAPQLKTTTGSFENWDSCKADLQAKWGQLGQHCDAMVNSSTVSDFEEYAAIAYTIAAGVCLVSCVATATKAIGAGSALQTACIVAGIGAALVDIGLMIAEAVKGSKDGGAWAEDVAGTAVGVAGGLSTVLASSVLQVGTKAAETAAEKTSQEVAKKVANDCVATAFLALAAGMKWGNYASLKGNKDAECKAVKQFASTATEMKTGGFNLPNLSGPSRSASRPGMGGDGGSNNDKSSALGGQSLSGGAGGGDSRIPENFDLDHPTFSAALGKDNSPFNPILKGLDHDKLKEAAATLGLNPRTIASQLQTQSPAQILQSMEGVGSEAATLQLLDKMSKDPKMSSALGGSAIMSSGGGKGVTKTAAAGPAFGFGAKTPAGGASEMGFDKVKKPGPKFDENGDIWHEGYKGTIFQIVSQKLDKTHERIQQLEWQTPLNRALMGLPKLKGQTSLIDRLPPSRGDSK